MTEDEIYEIFLEMMEERKVARKLPFEPSRMAFAIKVAEIAYERGHHRGHTVGWLEGHKSGSTGVFGEPLG
jgi:hypothetical protein